MRVSVIEAAEKEHDLGQDRSVDAPFGATTTVLPKQLRLIKPFVDETSQYKKQV